VGTALGVFSDGGTERQPRDLLPDAGEPVSRVLVGHDPGCPAVVSTGKFRAVTVMFGLISELPGGRDRSRKCACRSSQSWNPTAFTITVCESGETQGEAFSAASQTMDSAVNAGLRDFAEREILLEVAEAAREVDEYYKIPLPDCSLCQ
jgi:hypothetical protein